MVVDYQAWRFFYVGWFTMTKDVDKQTTRHCCTFSVLFVWNCFMTEISYYTESGRHRRASTSNMGISYYTAQRGSYSKHMTTLHWSTQHKGESTLYRVIILHRGNTVQGDYTSKPGLLYYIVHGDHTPKRAVIFCFGIRAQGESHPKHMAVILHMTGAAPHLAVFLLPSPLPSCSCDLIPPFHRMKQHVQLYHVLLLLCRRRSFTQYMYCRKNARSKRERAESKLSLQLWWELCYMHNRRIISCGYMWI